MKKLPDKLSDLLMLALIDLELVEADPGYVVDMDHWHAHDEYTDTCAVCLAGAVMSKSLRVPINFYRTPGDFDDDIFKGLLTIDRARNGRFDCLGIPIVSIEIANASVNNRPLWVQHMCDMIGILKAEGL